MADRDLHGAQFPTRLAADPITDRTTAPSAAPGPIASRMGPAEVDAALRAAAMLWDYELHARIYLSEEQQAAVRAALRAVAQHDIEHADQAPRDVDLDEGAVLAPAGEHPGALRGGAAAVPGSDPASGRPHLVRVQAQD